MNSFDTKPANTFSRGRQEFSVWPLLLAAATFSAVVFEEFAWMVKEPGLYRLPVNRPHSQW
jgi:hypothetical protein